MKAAESAGVQEAKANRDSGDASAALTKSGLRRSVWEKASQLNGAPDETGTKHEVLQYVYDKSTLAHRAASVHEMAEVLCELRTRFLDPTKRDADMKRFLPEDGTPTREAFVRYLSAKRPQLEANLAGETQAPRLWSTLVEPLSPPVSVRITMQCARIAARRERELDRMYEQYLAQKRAFGEHRLAKQATRNVPLRAANATAQVAPETAQVGGSSSPTGTQADAQQEDSDSDTEDLGPCNLLAPGALEKRKQEIELNFQTIMGAVLASELGSLMETDPALAVPGLPDTPA